MSVQAHSTIASGRLHFFLGDVAFLSSTNWDDKAEAGASAFFSFDLDEATTGQLSCDQQYVLMTY